MSDIEITIEKVKMMNELRDKIAEIVSGFDPQYNRKSTGLFANEIIELFLGEAIGVVNEGIIKVPLQQHQYHTNAARRTIMIALTSHFGKG